MDKHLHAAFVESHLSYAAMIRNGIDEAPLAVMRLAYFDYLAERSLLPCRPEEQEAIRKRLYNNAADARKRMRAEPAWGAYYAQRAMLRAVGRDPDTVPKPDARRLRRARQEAALAAAQASTPEARLALLRAKAERPLHIVAAHRYGERGADVRAERQALFVENQETLQARREINRMERAIARDDRRRGAAGSVPPATPRPGPSRDRRWMPDATYAQRVLADLAALERMGRPVPRASRHLQADVPLHLRRHHWLMG